MTRDEIVAALTAEIRQVVNREERSIDEVVDGVFDIVGPSPLPNRLNRRARPVRLRVDQSWSEDLRDSPDHMRAGILDRFNRSVFDALFDYADDDRERYEANA